MNGDNSEKNTEDDVEYHLYPYSYDKNGNDEIQTNVVSEDTEIEASAEDESSVRVETSEPVRVEAGTQAEKKTSNDIKSSEAVNAASETPVKEKLAEPTTKAGRGYYEPSRETPVVKKKSRKWQYIAFVLVLLFVIGASFAVIYQSFNGSLYSSNDKIAVIYIEGTLVTSSVPGGLGYASSEDISDNIRKALNDGDVKAIVLRVNSGGGASTAGEEAYEEVKKASESGVPVVVSMGSTAASAAYHLSSPADLIVANPSTMTGSIGTIWQFQNLSEYYDKEGIQYYIVKSGEFKDMGNPARGLSDDEKEYANKVVEEVYSNFVADVAEGRDMSVSEVKSLADGRIYTGREAKKLGLVDELGNFYDALDIAADLAGIEDPTIVYMNKPTLSSMLFGSETNADSTSELAYYYEDSPYGYIT
ncbi:signal peptide peptidase A. Serine peptidase. MEROPS family S49 [Methanolobus vulcani]|jgi:protease-4|uniref:Signal peptide peptidase A. Serine peptidase. MEROPS family S49 n=1 Tax=Methanolobus vulcani TaxID=38026 RepID=A0A7Z7FF34_9EURY|nr:signal peptide peptidase SppA [Methanolobus vulcani]MDK2825244.1 protease [Methanolobus sp.]MDK2948260.1 protease [Methanolobus sp.]SDG09808.1 signal peptide peptidase A. Serine peptidase. MEROPS family S49 [Methanolobus vulcani]